MNSCFYCYFVEYISLSIKLIVLTPHDQQRNKNCLIFGTIDVVEIYNEDFNNVIEIQSQFNLNTTEFMF